MGRDFSYYFIGKDENIDFDNIEDLDEVIDDDFLESHYEHYQPQFRNMVCDMSQVFTYNDLKEYIRISFINSKWGEVSAMSYIMKEWDKDEYYLVFIHCG